MAGSSHNEFFGKAWYKCLEKAHRRCLVSKHGIKRVHYRFETDQEMIEDWRYSTTNGNELVGRYWKRKSVLGNGVRWEPEIGDEAQYLIIRDSGGSCEAIEGGSLRSQQPPPTIPLLKENASNPTVSSKIAPYFYEWRIRNLVPPGDNYVVSCDADSKTVVVSTKNRKYYKKLKIMDMERFQLNLEAHKLSSAFANRTLIIKYEKIPEVIQLDKKIWTELIAPLEVPYESAVAAGPRPSGKVAEMSSSNTPNCAPV